VLSNYPEVMVNDPTHSNPKNLKKVNYDQLTGVSREHVQGSAYTRFVRITRVILPLIALGIVIILFSVKNVDNDMISPVKNEKSSSRDIKESVTRNELLNPEFVSSDKKKQPYKITALKAIQGEKNKDLIMLEKPIGTMVLNNGNSVRMTSKTGAYRQDTERFFLEGDVLLQHEQGYSIQSSEAHIDLNKNYAWSEKAVIGRGPDISIEAEGVQVDGKTGHIVFSGPAKLRLEKGFKSLEAGNENKGLRND